MMITTVPVIQGVQRTGIFSPSKRSEIQGTTKNRGERRQGNPRKETKETVRKGPLDQSYSVRKERLRYGVTI